ncbi:MAG TPA: TRAP transporter large permease [Bacillota bacterium]|nr:TRAP transporter large permease [Bacillota bacterium]HRS22076.1 TRAP transporter large permease [Clostridia bacterium]
MTILLFASFTFFVIIGMPVAFTLGLSSLVAIVLTGTAPLTVIVQRMFASIDSFSLMAIPMFILAGGIMDIGGISRRIVNFANIFVGAVKGGLAMVGVLGSMIFAGVSGSAVADTAAMGMVLIPSMIEKGYDKEFSGSVIAAAGTIGPIIPPSIPLVVYGVIANASIGDLFIGGVIPGVLIGIALMLTSYIIARKKDYPSEKRLTYKQAFQYTKEGIWAVLMPVVILGGILGGIFTPTEAGVVAVVYSFVVGKFIYKEIKMNQFPAVFKDAIINTVSVMFLIATASLFSWILTYDRIPQMVAEAFLSLSNNPFTILMIINVLLFILGTFMDVVPGLILMMPVLLPLVESVGINLVHFGVVVVYNLCIGLLTPPVGPTLCVAGNIAKVNLTEMSKAVMPFMGAMLIVLLIITYFPGTVLWLPSLLK